MGIGIAAVAPKAARSNLTSGSQAGVYRSRTDGTVVIKGDNDGKKGNRTGRTKPATQVTVLAANGRTFIKNIDKLTDQYDFVGSLNSFDLTPKSSSARRDF